MSNVSILANPLLNKGTGFKQEERDEMGLNGLIPPVVQSIEEQERQVYSQYQSKSSRLEQRIFLMDIYKTNRTLFYYTMEKHLVEFMPVVYDPVVADAIEEYSDRFVSPDAVYLSIHDQEHIKDALESFADGRDIRLIVVTDSEGILGMGDCGINGVEIATGKLAVYTAAAGVDPSKVLPVVLDVGTNNKELLDNPNYLGNKHERIRGGAYDQFIDKFVKEVTNLFPKALLHWEDFGRSNAAKILEKYQSTICTINDDIQGTGIVILAALLGSMKVSKLPMNQQKVLIFGAGTAGIGIANQILEEMLRTNDITHEEAKKRFYLVDQQGLLTGDLPDLTDGQKKFARPQAELNRKTLKDLKDIIAFVKPTVLIGTSTTPNAFTEEAIKEMAKHVERPAIFPISNPTKLIEAKAADVIKWTDGKALVCTGIPSDDVEYNGVTYQIGQGNNALMYPGLGLGIIVAEAKIVTQNMLSAAARAVGELVDPKVEGASILPPVADLQNVSKVVAEAVVAQAIKDGINQRDIADVKEEVSRSIWKPRY
ncbi:NAD-dependent malic enzyme [Bacillus sonorensis]|uniref:NAD-dependent malic enzyme n=1 Tax=Bacillus sonorensis TaxID=119858 RepID=UPI002282058B|nr:NAD-dependent malic enzyme [Bacillus sonorensis]MCZ0070810.1 NAD-dependent malic enzyme [Bacillus sonorensis]MCZ0098113.1 NAD-dependent malic enzyme [Bacillus sonorensis]MEC1519639.1 NAD-dependent malic enzyme [Bacillus sonorensis]